MRSYVGFGNAAVAAPKGVQPARGFVVHSQHRPLRADARLNALPFAAPNSRSQRGTYDQLPELIRNNGGLAVPARRRVGTHLIALRSTREDADYHEGNRGRSVPTTRRPPEARYPAWLLPPIDAIVLP